MKSASKIIRRNKIRSNPIGASFSSFNKEEIVSSPYSFTDIKKAAGFGKKSKPAVFVKDLLGDEFTTIPGNSKDRPRYIYSGKIKSEQTKPTKVNPMNSQQR